MPQGWEWVRLGEIGIWKSGSTPSRSNSTFYGGNIPWVKSGEVKQGRIRNTEETVTQAALDKCSLHINSKGSILVAMYGANIGEVGILEIEAATNQAVCSCKTYTNFDEIYLFYLITSLKPYFLSQSAGAAQPNISREKIIGTLFPLPPLAEQKRIVAKIDELMARCDELEKLRTAQQEARLTVNTAAIKQLLNIAEPDQHQRAQAFLSEHFGELYTVKENIAELRKAILQLAVMGKLAPQDPSDQPARELLKEIEAEKQWLVKEGKVKKSKPLQPINLEEVPYQLPDGWEWCRMQDVFLSLKYGTSKKCDYDGGTIPVLRIPNISKGRISIGDLKYADLSEKERTDLGLNESDLLVIRSNGSEGLVGRAAIVGKESSGFCYAGYLMRIRINGKLLNPCYLYFVFDCEMTRQAIEGPIRTTSGVKNVNSTEISQLKVPLPPFQEQHRIVARVDQLMALCDSLDQQIDATTSKQSELLNALIHVQSQGNTVEEPQPASLSKEVPITDLASYRASIGCYAINKLANAQYFGRTAAAKVIYLAQAHAGLKLDLKPEREAAGPLDTWIYDFERQGQDQGWFEVHEKTLANGRKKTEYRCLSALSAPAAKAEALMSPSQKAEFDRLIYTLADKKTEEVEIIATLFAVWNDFLIDGVQATDEQIIAEVRENWHERKARFTPAELGRWLDWLRKENFMPRGLPPRTVQQARLSFD
ncbi:hypothetical protein B0T39_18940 [Chromobacterium haemolyticum]|nr:hypothetical protein B0T39_18940 [Chromobacterium haemolyticum]